jgi:pimeloyl-ACP methyl ester carboxylesterase
VHDQAALVERFIADHHLDRVTLVGHSMGGGVALAVALDLTRQRPGVLQGLILLDAASFRQRLPFFISQLRWPVVGRVMQSLTSVTVQVRSVLKKVYYDDRLIPDASVEAYAAALRMPGGKYAIRETAKQIVPDDIDALTAGFKTIHVPTLIIWGRYDEIVPLAIGERLHEAMPGSTFEVIDHTGHAPHEETPEAVRPLLEKFLR